MALETMGCKHDKAYFGLSILIYKDGWLLQRSDAIFHYRMKIHVRGLHTDLTPVIIEYTQKRLAGLSKFLQNKDVICDVELIKTTNHHKQGDIFKAEANISIDKEQVYAVSEKPDLYQAVDELRDELEAILSSRKDRKNTLFRRGALQVKNVMKGLGSFGKRLRR